MMDKKALGLHWYIAALAFIISMGILAWGNINTKIPLVGQFSAATAHALENGNNIAIEVEGIMRQLNTEASISYEKHKVFALDSYCNDTFDGDKDGITQENTKYKDRLLAANPSFKTPKSGEPNHFTAREEVKCYAAEEEFMKYYEEAFNAEYSSFKSATWKNLNLDFSSINYASEIIKEENGEKRYFNLLTTDNAFIIPITMEDKDGIKNIGSFTVKPNSKIEIPNPANRPFDGHEVCIFAADCGANCHDVIERNPRGDYVLRENAIPASKCGAYYDCITPVDQFGDEFSCSRNLGDPPSPLLCKGSCSPYCSQALTPPPAPDATGADYTDSSVWAYAVDDVNTHHPDLTVPSKTTLCKEFSCSTYMDCGNVGANTCACSSQNGGFTNACTGNNCMTRNCNRDVEYEARYISGERTICLSTSGSGGYATYCGAYGNCQPTSGLNSCSCDADLTDCVGLTSDPNGVCYCKSTTSYPGWYLRGECPCGVVEDVFTYYAPSSCHGPTLAFTINCGVCPTTSS